mgnify:CR=1 FL=1|jgi:hypothetical protein
MSGLRAWGDYQLVPKRIDTSRARVQTYRSGDAAARGARSCSTEGASFARLSIEVGQGRRVVVGSHTFRKQWEVTQ